MSFIRALLTKEQISNFTDGEEAMVDFFDKMHDRLLEKNSQERPQLADYDTEYATRCLANIGKNLTEAFHEVDNNVVSANATVDIANLAYIADVLMTRNAQS
jgi:hypothetical protein